MARSVAPKKKATFSLSGGVLQEMKELLETEHAGSQNRFVEDALQEHIRKVRKEMLRREYAEAARDPLFLKDVRRVQEDFARADDEALGPIS